MVFIGFLICMPGKKKNMSIKPLKELKSFFFIQIKQPTLTLKLLVKHISDYLNKNPINLNLSFSFQTTKILFLPVMVITCMSFLFTSVQGGYPSLPAGSREPIIASLLVAGSISQPFCYQNGGYPSLPDASRTFRFRWVLGVLVFCSECFKCSQCSECSECLECFWCFECSGREFYECPEFSECFKY